MSKARMYGAQSAHIPNRKADEFSRNRTFKHNKDWEDRHFGVLITAHEQKMWDDLRKMKEEFDPTANPEPCE